MAMPDTGGLHNALADLERAQQQRSAERLARTRRTFDSPQGPRVRIGDKRYLAFASNDYLGLASAPELIDAACEGARRWGVGAGASHLIAGHLAPHAELENELAAFVDPCEAARGLTFSSGYLANLAILTALAGRHDAVFADRLNHASLVDAALLSRATLVRYPHNDVDALERAIAATPSQRRFIVTDGVFSMDGDIAPIRRLLELAERTDAWLVVDDAHGFGVLGDGRGLLAHCGVRSTRVVYMATLGKAAGVSGAFVVAHPLVIETLIQKARSYIYTTAAPAMLAVATSAALAMIRNDGKRREHLAELIATFRKAASALPWQLLPSTTPIQPIVIGDVERTLAISAGLAARNILVPAIRPPTVPVGTARLRISLSAAHTLRDVDQLASALRDVAGSVQ
jgi:8-amino-7-oxononanoate synthase